MKTREIIEKLDCKILSGKSNLNTEVTGGYCSDLLSDVMGNAELGNIWITVQIHKNIMAVAALKELAALIIVKGLQPEEEILSISEKEGIPVLSTSLSAFEVAGRLYQLLQIK